MACIFRIKPSQKRSDFDSCLAFIEPKNRNIGKWVVNGGGVDYIGPTRQSFMSGRRHSCMPLGSWQSCRDLRRWCSKSVKVWGVAANGRWGEAEEGRVCSGDDMWLGGGGGKGRDEGRGDRGWPGGERRDYSGSLQLRWDSPKKVQYICGTYHVPCIFLTKFL